MDHKDPLADHDPATGPWLPDDDALKAAINDLTDPEKIAMTSGLRTEKGRAMTNLVTRFAEKYHYREGEKHRLKSRKYQTFLHRGKQQRECWISLASWPGESHLFPLSADSWLTP